MPWRFFLKILLKFVLNVYKMDRNIQFWKLSRKKFLAKVGTLLQDCINEQVWWQSRTELTTYALVTCSSATKIILTKPWGTYRISSIGTTLSCSFIIRDAGFVWWKGLLRTAMWKIFEISQFVKFHSSQNQLFIIAEQRFKAELLDLWKKQLMFEDAYWEARSCGGYTARLYNLAKVYKKDCLLRPVHSMPCAMYELLSKQLASIIIKIPEAECKCNAQEINRNLRQFKLNEDQQPIWLHIVSLFNNVPVDEPLDYTAKLFSNRRMFMSFPWQRYFCYSFATGHQSCHFCNKDW